MDNNNNNVQYANINQYDDSQNVPNNDGSYYNGNQETNQSSQVNENAPLVQFNVILLESYDSAQNAQVEQPTSEELSFPFSQEPSLQHDKMFSFCNDNWNT